MRLFRTAFLAFVATLSFAGCASNGTARDTDAGIKGSEKLSELRRAASRLERRMPALQVEELLGPPTTSESATCDRATGRSWPCTLWRYETATATPDLQAVLAVYLHCEMVRRLDLAQALHRQGLITNADLAAYRNDPQAVERVELCIVDDWRWL